MARYRHNLPQLSGDIFLTDGGLETTLIFHDGLELPEFAAFHLLRSEQGRAALRKYFLSYIEIARRFDTGLILESATWRASVDWGRKIGYMPDEVATANRQAIQLLRDIRDETGHAPIVISGCIGPRGDGYIPGNAMTAGAAEAYHREQAETFAATVADMLCGITMNYAEEAIGVARAAKSVGMPVAISFTVETDGCLPTGQSVADAIRQVDAATSHYPEYYMLNCAHPSHFESMLAEDTPALGRIRGLRANASRKSHEELNESTEIDIGDPRELGSQYANLIEGRWKQLNIVGGCCGTDHRHVAEIAEACLPLFRIPLMAGI